MPRYIALTTAVALVAISTVALAEGFDARAYHGSNCTRCHDTSVYTRESRKMQSYDMLSSRVAGCDARFGEKLSPEGVSGLVDYLNDSYYKFSK